MGTASPSNNSIWLYVYKTALLVKSETVIFGRKAGSPTTQSFLFSTSSLFMRKKEASMYRFKVKQIYNDTMCPSCFTIPRHFDILKHTNLSCPFEPAVEYVIV